MTVESTSSQPKTGNEPASAAESARPLSVLPPLRLGRTLRAGLRETWDRLGLVIALSLTWTLLLCLPLTLGRLLPTSFPLVWRYGLVALVAALLLSAPAAGAFALAHRIYAHDEVSYADFWRESGRMLAPATRLGLIHLAAWVLFGVNLWFYLHIGPLLGALAALICLYAFLFWNMMAVYHFSLLAAQEMGIFDEPGRRARRGAFAVLRRSFFLALGEPGFSFGLLVATLLVSALLFVTVALPPLLWLGTMALLTTAATRALLVKYEVLPAPPQEEVVPDEKFHIKDFRQD